MVIFSYERGYQGPNGTPERIYRYVATTYDEFWRRYKHMRQRHFYEVRRELICRSTHPTHTHTPSHHTRLTAGSDDPREECVPPVL